MKSIKEFKQHKQSRSGNEAVPTKLNMLAPKASSTRDEDTSRKGPEAEFVPRVSVYTKGKARLSKRESVFFKPTDKDNKMLGELVIKVASF